MGQTYVGITQWATGNANAASQTWAGAYQHGVLGQTANSPGHTYYGTRTALGVATAATAAAVVVGSTEFLVLGNQPIGIGPGTGWFGNGVLPDGPIPPLPPGFPHPPLDNPPWWPPAGAGGEGVTLW